jgi:hypothetical protein
MVILSVILFIGLSGRLLLEKAREIPSAGNIIEINGV